MTLRIMLLLGGIIMVCVIATLVAVAYLPPASCQPVHVAPLPMAQP